MAPFPVRAVVVIHRARFPPSRITIDGIPVPPPPDPVGFIASQPAVYPLDAVARLAARIDRDLPRATAP